MITDHTHISYLGARVGSNNTGELCAIVEAILFAIEAEYTQIIIHSDSQWAINVLTGRWGAKTHKELVTNGKRLLKHSGLDVQLHWIKGHAGNTGNERADRLAEEGKNRAEATGGRNIPLPHTTPPTTTAVHSDAFAKALHAAAHQTFTPHTRVPRTPWIQDATLQALDAARKAQAVQAENYKQLRNQAKRMARKDRVKWVHDQLAKDPGGTRSTVWNVIRQQRKGFVGKRNQLVRNGKAEPWSRSHLVFRDHLEQKQWANPHIADHTAAQRRAQPQIHPTQPDQGEITMEELQDILRAAKKNKAPGPDELHNELYKLLNEEGRNRLLAIFNHSWRTGTTPHSWSEATVVSIFKGKGDPTDPASYRPISLLNAAYKLYAAILQKRLAAELEHRLRASQFGFRAHRGTAQPLFVIRRAMEWSINTTTPLHFLFLDWKQAFDSLDHTAMLDSMRRLGTSSKMIRAIQAIYDTPTFYTQGMDGTLAKGVVGAGIRQGCPLSPYCFRFGLPQ